MTDTVAELRAELEKLHGPAKVAPLTRLAQILAQQYWRTGPGRPEAQPDLDEAIAALQECLEHLRAGDSVRGQVAAQLGWLLGARYGAHTQDERDRVAGLEVLTEALESPHLTRVHREMCQVQRGQLWLGRATGALRSPDMATQLIGGGVAPEVRADVDRAAACFRQLLADGPSSRELADGVESLLAVAEILQTMLSGTAGAGIDVPAMLGLMTKVQQLQDRFRQAVPGRRGSDTFFSFADMKSLMEIEPIDRPVAVVVQPEPEPEPAEPVPAPPAPDGDRLRRSLHEKLGGAEPIWARAAELLRPDAPALSVEAVDELVALATMVAEGQPTAVDRFVLAVALALRDRLDDGGDRADAVAGAESLLAAVRELPAGHPARPVMLLSLGAFLDEERPFGGPLEVVAGEFADRADAAIAAGIADPADLAALHALRCLCRAAEAVAEFRRAAVPPDYPWRNALKAAAQEAG
ncbi:hypothetical protein [Amycolatopsis sp. NPDC051102]|uniref:hypothetical protein n=1 Tax=Amycolatopsis sp. NPDC051102 TaxID=3155163 RepID=UPI003443ED65